MAPLFSVDGRDMLLVRDTLMTMRVSAPFGKMPIALFANDGSVIVGHTGSPLLTVIEPTGRVSRVIEIAAPVMPVSERAHAELEESVRRSVRDALQRSGVDSGEVEVRQRRYNDWLDTIEYPRVFPLYSTATIDEQDRIWIAQTDTLHARNWQVWNFTSGTLEGPIRIPHSFEVVSAAVRDGNLYALEVDGRGRYFVVRCTIDTN